MKRLIAFATAALIVLCASACSVPGQTGTGADSGTAAAQTPAPAGNTDTTQAPAAEKILRYSNLADIATLDPGKTNSVPDATVGYHIYDPLYRNVQGTLQPATAESYDLSDDGLVYTFHLRKDAKWSDGTPVTAQDFEYGIKRICDPEAASPMSYLMDVVKNGTAAASGEVSLDEVGVKALDDSTLEITLQYPADYFLGMLSMSVFEPVPQTLAEKYGVEYGSAADKAIYNGPFKVTQYGEGRLVMEKNENYYDADKIKLDGVEVITVADASTAVSLFEQGELDQVDLPTELAVQYLDSSYTYYSGADDYAALNHNNKYLANKNFRLAMNYAIDREEYILLSHEGLYQANQRYVLPQVRGVNGDYGDEFPLEAFPLKADLDKAKEYLEAAKAELGFSDPSAITLKLVVTDSDTAKKEAEIVANQWKNNLGINIDINLVPYATRNAMLVPNNNDFDIIMTGWAPDYSDPYSYLELWYSTSGYNYLNYHSSVYDGYLDTSRTTRGQERAEALFNAEKTLLEDGALVPLQLREVHYLVADRVENLQSYFIGLNYNYMYADIVG